MKFFRDISDWLTGVWSAQIRYIMGLVGIVTAFFAWIRVVWSSCVGIINSIKDMMSELSAVASNVEGADTTIVANLSEYVGFFNNLLPLEESINILLMVVLVKVSVAIFAVIYGIYNAIPIAR